MKKKNKKNKEIEPKKTLKNYLILLIVFAVGIGLTLYLCKWYKVIDEEKKQTPVIRGTITNELYPGEVDTFLVEYPSTVLYLCTSDSTKCRNFEKHFKKYINSSELADYIVYVNLTGANQDEFVENFNNKYGAKKTITSSYPALVVLDNGKISDIIQTKKDKKITIKDTKEFLEENNIGE